MVLGRAEEEPDAHEEQLEDEEEPLLPGKSGEEPPPLNERVCGALCSIILRTINLCSDICMYLCFEDCRGDLERLCCGALPKGFRSRRRLPRFYLPVRAPNIGTGADHTGVVHFSLEFVPESQLSVKPCGIGREEPNAHPFLPKPW